MPVYVDHVRARQIARYIRQQSNAAWSGPLKAGSLDDAADRLPQFLDLLELALLEYEVNAVELEFLAAVRID